ncbi:MAG: trypsin-like peptidase domain-containing protein [Candidatus Microsaccharimonas sp.]
MNKDTTETDAPTTPIDDTPTAPDLSPVATPEKATAEKTAPETPAVKPSPTPASNKNLIVAVIAIVGSILLIGIGVVGGNYIRDFLAPNDTPALSVTHDGNAAVSDEERTITAVVDKVGPSVVSIVTETQSNSIYRSTSGSAAGTGIIISKDGYIMTNNHVLENARTVSVVDSNGELYEDATIVGRDPLNDIAFIKVDGKSDFTAAELGDSSSIRTGQQIVAIGNALGQYNNTVTSGIVSGTGRPVTAGTDSGATETLTDLIQTDASINPGNSGGPLVNMAGQVIGINTAIVEDANGIGFAIPVNATKGILKGVLETGSVTRAYLGVNYLTITPDVAREFDLSVTSGAYVYASQGNPVVSGSPADKASLKKGDVITKVNSKTIGKQGGLSSLLGEYQAGDKITLTILRDGKEQTTSLTLGTYKD